MVLLYVDDILCALENADLKTNMFSKLDKDYGLKDQCFLNTYLGVEVEQNKNTIKIHQTKYRGEMKERFNFGDAHTNRIPMETTLQLTTSDTDTAQHNLILVHEKLFLYRKAI